MSNDIRVSYLTGEMKLEPLEYDYVDEGNGEGRLVCRQTGGALAGSRETLLESAIALKSFDPTCRIHWPQS